jgi:hypothetical protein
MQRTSTPQADEKFRDLYQELASAWDSHEELRSQNSPIVALAESSQRLYEARGAMWDWWHHHRRDRSR